MRNKVIGAAALAAALLVSGTASAANVGIYYLNELGMSQSAFIKMFGNKSAAKAAQDEINSNPAVAEQLRDKGVQIKNVILAKDAADGSRIYFVK